MAGGGRAGRRLQELKAPQEKFPIKAIGAAGYCAVWQGQKSWNGVAILAEGQEPHLTRRGLPREPEDEHGRYIEAIVNGIVIGGLYLPNGNPYPGPKFDYKLHWFKRLQDYAAELLELEVPVILAGDFNVMPTEMDVYKLERWMNDCSASKSTQISCRTICVPMVSGTGPSWAIIDLY